MLFQEECNEPNCVGIALVCQKYSQNTSKDRAMVHHHTHCPGHCKLTEKSISPIHSAVPVMPIRMHLCSRPLSWPFLAWMLPLALTLVVLRRHLGYLVHCGGILPHPHPATSALHSAALVLLLGMNIKFMMFCPKNCPKNCPNIKQGELQIRQQGGTQESPHN